MSSSTATGEEAVKDDQEPVLQPEEGILGCRGVSKAFGSTQAVDDVTLGIDRGEWLSIVGPNGSGKTSLLNIFNGFYSADSGQVFHEGEDITRTKSFSRARRGIGRTFQSAELFEGQSVIENIQTVRSVADRPRLIETIPFYGPARRTEVENLRKVEEIIDYFELWEYRDEEIGPLPLGIRRRVDLARACALDPDILVLDEPMSGLTSEEKYDIIRLIADLHEDEGITIVLVEHDLEVVTAVSERLVVMNQGSIIANGPTDMVIDDPLVEQVYTEV